MKHDISSLISPIGHLWNSLKFLLFLLYLEQTNKKHDIDDSNQDNEKEIGIIVSQDKRIYENQIAELVSDCILADSKAAHFYLECIALQKRNKSKDKEKVMFRMALGVANCCCLFKYLPKTAQPI